MWRKSSMQIYIVKGTKIVVYSTQCATFLSIARIIAITPAAKESTLQYVV